MLGTPELANPRVVLKLGETELSWSNTWVVLWFLNRKFRLVGMNMGINGFKNK